MDGIGEDEIQRQQQAVRAAFSRRLGGPVNETAWEWLTRLGKVHAGTLETLEDLYGEYFALDQYLADEMNFRLTRAREADPRNRALSHIVAIDAEQLPDVTSFRAFGLGGGLLPVDGVHGWIRDRLHEEEGPRGPWESRKGLLVSPSLTKQRPHSFQYVSIPPGGLLEDWHDLSNKLARRCSWTPPDAALFLLSGGDPEIQLLVAREWRPADSHAEEFGQPSYEFETRIQLNINVRVPPGELASLYEDIRREIVGTRRDRAISDHHAELGMFAAEHRRGWTWAEALQRWNEHNPEWSYEAEALFVRDARLAFLRITGSPLDWEGKTTPSRALEAKGAGPKAQKRKPNGAP